MLFVIKNPILSLQSLEKVEPNFKELIMDLDDLRSDATHKIYGICFYFLQKHICGDSLILNLQKFYAICSSKSHSKVTKFEKS